MERKSITPCSIFLKDVILLNEHGTTYIRPYFLCFALIIPVVQITFIEVDVDLGYALYFSALVLNL